MDARVGQVLHQLHEELQGGKQPRVSPPVGVPHHAVDELARLTVEVVVVAEGGP
jgi:hypothetical protein